MGLKLISREPLRAKLGGVSVSTVYEWMEPNPDDPEHDPLPKPIKLSANKVAWLEDEVDAWLERRVAKRDALNPKRGGTPAGETAAVEPA
jgi:predicted DNA-binding transcriptional regulator AlpA